MTSSSRVPLLERVLLWKQDVETCVAETPATPGHFWKATAYVYNGGTVLMDLTVGGCSCAEQLHTLVLDDWAGASGRQWLRGYFGSEDPQTVAKACQLLLTRMAQLAVTHGRCLINHAVWLTDHHLTTKNEGEQDELLTRVACRLIAESHILAPTLD